MPCSYWFYRWFNADPELLKCENINPKRANQIKNYTEQILKEKGKVTFDNSKEDIERFKTTQKQIPESQFYRQNPANTGCSIPTEIQELTKQYVKDVETPRPLTELKAKIETSEAKPKEDDEFRKTKKVELKETICDYLAKYGATEEKIANRN